MVDMWLLVGPTWDGIKSQNIKIDIKFKWL